MTRNPTVAELAAEYRGAGLTELEIRSLLGSLADAETDDHPLADVPGRDGLRGAVLVQPSATPEALRG